MKLSNKIGWFEGTPIFGNPVQIQTSLEVPLWVVPGWLPEPFLGGQHPKQWAPNWPSRMLISSDIIILNHLRESLIQMILDWSGLTWKMWKAQTTIHVGQINPAVGSTSCRVWSPRFSRGLPPTLSSSNETTHVQHAEAAKLCFPRVGRWQAEMHCRVKFLWGEGEFTPLEQWKVGDAIANGLCFLLTTALLQSMLTLSVKKFKISARAAS